MGLKVWLPLNGTLENKGTSNIQVVSGTPSYKVGKIGASALNLNNRIVFDCPALANLQTFSICFWGMAEASTTLTVNWTDLMGFTDVSASGSNGTFRWETGYNGNNGIHWHDNATNAMVNGAHNHITQHGFWKHCCVVFDYAAGELYSYDDGVLTQTHTHAGGHFNSTGRFYLGETNKIEGRITDVRIYDHALSAAEVREISQGLVLHYKLNGFQGGSGNPNLITNFDTSFLSYADGATTLFTNQMNSGTQEIISHFMGTDKCLHLHSKGGNNRQYRTFSATAGKTYTVSADYYSTVAQNLSWRGELNGGDYSWFAASAGAYNTPGVWQRMSYTFSNLTSNAIIYFFIYCANGTDCYIKNIKIEEGTSSTPWCPNGASTIIQDSSGYNNNGTILNAVSISSDTPRYSYSTKLEAANSMINCGRGGMVTDSITVNIWIKSSAWANPVSCTEGGGWNFESSDTCFRFPVYVSGVGYKYGKSTTTKAQICNNEWHMLTGIYDRINQKIQIYVDGQLDNDYATGTSNNIGYHGSNCIWIGAEATGSSTTASNGMSGLFSDFRIYCTPLSEGDIKQLYNLGAKIDNNQNIHTNEFIETSKNLFSSTIWTDGYGNHNPNTRPFLNYNDQGEPIFTTNSTHAGSDYIEINPTNKTYYYDMVLSINAGNQAYIGFHRYDAEKTARSNNATVYIYQTKPSADIIKKRFTGTVNLSTDGVNPCKYISLRVLNGWSGTTSGVTGTLIIHRFSLREVQNMQYPKITEQSQLITEELDEWNDAKFYQDGIIESNHFIER